MQYLYYLKRLSRALCICFWTTSYLRSCRLYTRSEKPAQLGDMHSFKDF